MDPGESLTMLKIAAKINGMVNTSSYGTVQQNVISNIPSFLLAWLAVLTHSLTVILFLFLDKSFPNSYLTMLHVTIYSRSLGSSAWNSGEILLWKCEHSVMGIVYVYIIFNMIWNLRVVFPEICFFLFLIKLMSPGKEIETSYLSAFCYLHYDCSLDWLFLLMVISF